MALAYETHKNEAAYGEFAEQMTKEVVAACEAAHEVAGADEIVVRTATGTQRIDPLCMPDYVTLIQGQKRSPYNMMSGLDGSFDRVMYIRIPCPGRKSRICHQPHLHGQQSVHSFKRQLYERIHAEQLHSCYTQGSGAVPVGDSTICGLAREMVPDITTA